MEREDLVETLQSGVLLFFQDEDKVSAFHQLPGKSATVRNT